MLTQSVLSKEYVKTVATAVKNGVAFNPTSDAVVMAFKAPGVDPLPGDFVACDWETAPGPRYIARCLVGPGGTVALPVGTYRVWIKVTDSPEIPVEPFAYLRIF